MSNKILFRFGTENQTLTRFGELGFIYRACYFRGKELGYNDGNIYFEWPLKLEYSREHHLKRIGKSRIFGFGGTIADIKNISEIKCPRKTILPIRFIENKDVNISEYDKVINLIDRGALYEDSPPIYEIKLDGTIIRRHQCIFNFLNKYYLTYQKRPIFNINKDTINNKYILVHTRYALNSIERNPSIQSYEVVLKLLKDNYPKYKLYRCGEQFPIEKEFGDLFDRYIPKSSTFNEFLKLMNGSSLFVGCTSGPIEYAKGMDIPTIELDIPKRAWDDTTLDNYYSEEYWKVYMKGKYGKTIDEHINQNLIFKSFRDNDIDEESLIKYLNKWL